MSILDPGGVREETGSPPPPGPLGSKQELSPPTALQSPVIMAPASHEEGCVNTSPRKPGQGLQMSAQRLCTQGPSLWSVFALLKKGRAWWTMIGFEPMDHLCQQREFKTDRCRVCSQRQALRMLLGLQRARALLSNNRGCRQGHALPTGTRLLK